MKLLLVLSANRWYNIDLSTIHRVHDMRKTFTINGKRYEVTGKTQKQLDDRYFYKRLEVERLNSEKTVEEFCTEWLDRYKRHRVTDKNYKGYVSLLSKYVYPFIGQKKLGSVTKKDCQTIINNLHGYSDFYIHKLNFTLKGIFNMAVDEGLIEHNPALYLVKPKGHTKKRRSLTAKEKEELLKCIDGKYFELYFKLMLYCGLRPHECAYVQGKDINTDVLHIRGIKTANADRYVPIPKSLILPDLGSEEYLFENLTEKKRNRWWNSLKKDLGNVDWTPYCLRHTYCTDLERMGIPINIARQLMGHSDITITSKIYTHTNQKTLETIVNSTLFSHTDSHTKR